MGDECARRCDRCRYWVPFCEQWGGEDFGACRLEVEAAPGARRRERTRERAMSDERDGRTPMRSTDLGALQGLMFEELDNLMSLDMSGDPDAIAAEMRRAEAVSTLAGVAIDNANTVLRVVQQQQVATGEVKRIPRMICAG